MYKYEEAYSRSNLIVIPGKEKETPGYEGLLYETAYILIAMNQANLPYRTLTRSHLQLIIYNGLLAEV